MNVVLYGASGMVGSRVLQELLRRGHTVTAVTRNPETVTAAGVKAVKGDVTDWASVALTAKGADAVISAYAPPQGHEETIVDATRSLLSGLQKAEVKRAIFVGGAGSLEVAPGVQLVDVPNFPESYKAIAIAHRNVLPLLKESNLDWSYLSPAAIIAPGERTGKFRLGTTKLVSDAKGESRISAEDYAIVLVDELESPKYIRQQFTAAY
jgi:putative NADH-flavin reductase